VFEFRVCTGLVTPLMASSSFTACRRAVTRACTTDARRAACSRFLGCLTLSLSRLQGSYDGDGEGTEASIIAWVIAKAEAGELVAA
jgi:hypothetical protein